MMMTMVDLSRESKRTLGQISGGPLDEASNVDEDWLDDGFSADGDFEIPAEGGEVEYLREYAGR